MNNIYATFILFELLDNQEKNNLLTISVVSAGTDFIGVVLKLESFAKESFLKKAFIRGSDFSFSIRCDFNFLLKLPLKCTRLDIINLQNVNSIIIQNIISITHNRLNTNNNMHAALKTRKKTKKYLSIQL